MADNVTSEAVVTSGATFAADDISSVYFPRNKITLGADGVNDGDVSSANPMPVTGTITAVTTITNAVAVTDNSGSLTVDNSGTFAVQAAQSGTWNVTNVSGTISLPTGAATAAKQPALGTAGTASADVISIQGIASMTAIQVADNGGSLTVDNGGTFAVQAAQSGTWNITNVSGTVSLPTGASTAAKQPALGTAGTASADVITVQGIASMTPLVVTESNPVTTVTVQGPSSHDGSLGLAGSVMPVLIGGFSSAAAPTSVNADGDAVNGWFLRNGAQATVITAAGALIGGDASNGLDVDVTRVGGTVTVAGDVAHDAADSGNPQKIGARAAATLSDDTMVANGDRTDAVSDLDGALLMRAQYPLGDIVSERVSNTDGASTAFTNFSAVANTRNVITAVVLHNASASDGYVDFRDGTAGSVLYTVPIPAGGGAILPAGSTPYFRTSANTALAFDVSAALTTVYISVTGFKSKV